MSVWAWNTRNLVGSSENTTKYLKPIAMLSMVVSHVVTSSCPVGVVGISPFLGKDQSTAPPADSGQKHEVGKGELGAPDQPFDVP